MLLGASGHSELPTIDEQADEVEPTAERMPEKGNDYAGNLKSGEV